MKINNYIDFNMKRGRLDVAAEVLRETIRNPNLAPTRIMARTGVSYQMLNPLISRGLLEVVNITKKKGRRLRITERGRLFLEHYKICEELFPPIQKHFLKTNLNHKTNKLIVEQNDAMSLITQKYAKPKKRAIEPVGRTSKPS